MNRITSPRSPRKRLLSTAFQGLPDAFSFYVIPLAIALLCLAALLLWDDVYSSKAEKPLEFHALIEEADEAQLPGVLQKLADTPLTRYFNPRLSEHPVWFSLDLPPPLDASMAIEFPSRHAVALSCWDSRTQTLLGTSTAIKVDDDFFRVKAGFGLKFDATRTSIVCRTSFSGPARLSVNLWTLDELNNSARDFHRKSGLLDGGMLVLVAFVVITAVIYRQKLNIIFAAWLIVTLRVSATSAGWDDQWLSHAVPVDWLATGRSLTRAAWGLLTITLFKNLFREHLRNRFISQSVAFGQWLCIGLFVAAFTLARPNFLTLMWITGGVLLPMMILGLIVIVYRTRSHAALLYGAALAVMLISSLFEILAAAYGTRGIDNSLNSVAVAFASSLLASLAISEQIRQEHRQRLVAQAQLQHTYDAMPVGLFTLDLQGVFLSANPAMHKMLGRFVLRRGHNAWADFFSNGSWHALHEALLRQPEAEIEVRSHASVPRDRQRRYLVKATQAGDKIEGSLQDITDRSIAAEEMRYLAHNDALTKVLNRRGIEEMFDQAQARLHEGRPLAMAYLDLDRFKLINDLYGHNTGDEILREVCARVQQMLSGSMSMGRVGGDEFIILLPDTHMPLASVICRGILERIDDQPYRVGEKAFHVHGSIGLIEVVPGTRMKDAISTADRACREAKASPGKGLVVYERGAPAFREHEAEIRLAESLAGESALDGLYLVMQPIMSLTRPSDTLNFEVLLRMRDPHGEPVPLHRLIAAAEHSGRMGMIDRWVLSTTLAWLDEHRPRLLKTQFVCVNLSGTSLNDEEFMEEVFDLLRGNSHVASFLSIEITESVALHDLNNTRRFIDKVRGFGARVALDDFGAGYTSFAYIKELPADLLKIDGSFIVSMNQHPANVSIVEAIVNLARNLGMKTVAEWAEDADTVETLAEIGVDYVQGYVVSHPQPPEQLLQAASSASFISDSKLLQLVALMGQPDDPLGKVDLILDDDTPPPRKVH